ncbi:MAG: glycosyltransferase [Gammaproteobacteria bacterium]|jgi:glycosyltransferase involved in cell wall biosynthesis|nr:glycosyltransferase [Gammaproteobacteria bacterium]
MSLSIVIPAKNESGAIGTVVTTALEQFPDAEVIVVDDGSTDDTAKVAADAGAKVVSHPESLGNGAAVKSGARAATGDRIAFMDGDGQHDARELVPLIKRLDEGFEMAIGARNTGSHANVGRLFANGLYNGIASIMSGRKILDLTSGFRVARAEKFKQFLYLLPNGFSYPTTITMAFLRSGYPITFEPISAAKRVGKSHIRPLRDGVRFMIIIFKVATLYSPLKIFLPASGLFFATGLGYYAYTYVTMGRFTNMSMLLFSASVIIFLIGLISEQITALTYSRS